MLSSRRNFKHWLVIPGTIYWGVSIEGFSSVDSTTGHAPQYAVFNTMPVYYRGKLLHTHNKAFEADALRSGKEIWGYKLASSLPPTVNCGEVGDSKREICGARTLIQWMHDRNHPKTAKYLQKYGLVQLKPALLIHGLVVGLDICADHRVRGRGYRAVDRISTIENFKKFDLQVLISSGMSFGVPEDDSAISLHLRENGIALSADGLRGTLGKASRLFVMQRGGTNWDNGKPKTFLGMGRKINLGKDYKEMPPKMLGSWLDVGCTRIPDNHVCHMCAIPEKYKEITSDISEQRRLLCRSEVGNWHVLKIWGFPGKDVNGKIISSLIPLPKLSVKVRNLMSSRDFRKKLLDGPIGYNLDTSLSDALPPFQT